MQIPDGLSTQLMETFECNNTPNVTTFPKDIQKNKQHTTGNSSFTLECPLFPPKKQTITSHTRDMGSLKMKGFKKNQE